MGVKLAIAARRELRRLGHQPPGHRKRRARRERDPDAGAGPRIVEQFQHALAVAQDRLLILHDFVGRQAAVLLRKAHRPAGHRHAQAELARFLDLDVDRVLEPRREQIVMIGRRRAAGKHQLGQGKPHRDAQVARLHPRPDRRERGQPGDQIAVDRRRVGAGQRLVEMMMRVDEAGQHHMTRRVERSPDRRRRRPAARHQFDDARPLDHHAALGALGENGERVLDPQAHEGGAF